MTINKLVQQIKIPLLTNPRELDYFTIHQKRYKIILVEILTFNLPEKSRVLDIGCYPLHLFNALKREPFCFNVSGIASNHEPVHEETIVQLNIEKDKLPFKSDLFDLVVMTELIEHLTINPAVYLSEVKRVMKKGGLLILTTPNAAHLKNRAKAVMGKSPSFPLEQLINTYAEDDSIYHRHNREFTMEELKEIVQRSMLYVKRYRYESFYTPFREGKKFDVIKTIGYAITQLIPQTKDSLLVVATK
jgi:SAM-dependent methyltransferase